MMRDLVPSTYMYVVLYHHPVLIRHTHTHNIRQASGNAPWISWENIPLISLRIHTTTNYGNVLCVHKRIKGVWVRMWLIGDLIAATSTPSQDNLIISPSKAYPGNYLHLPTYNSRHKDGSYNNVATTGQGRARQGNLCSWNIRTFSHYVQRIC